MACMVVVKCMLKAIIRAPVGRQRFYNTAAGSGASRKASTCRIMRPN